MRVHFSLAGKTGKTYTIRIDEVRAYDPALIKTIIEIDLMTYSEPTWSRATANLMLRYGHTWLLMADEMCIGTCHFLRSWDNPNEAVLFSMAIRPGWRGRGLGKRFLQGVIEELPRLGVQSIVLEVDANNRYAIRLYEHNFGFRVVGTNQTAEEITTGSGAPKLTMRLELRAGDAAAS